MHHIKVSCQSELLSFLLSALNGQSRTTVKSYLAHRQVLVNGRLVTDFNYCLKPGDDVQILDRGISRQNPNSRLGFVYEDDYLIVADKKHGLLTISSNRSADQTAYSILSDHVHKYAKRNHTMTDVFAVHSLDRDTSGLLLFAKSQELQRFLQQNWENNSIRRKYVAVVEGSLSQTEGQIVSWLTENKKNMRMLSSPTDNGGDKAVTNYKMLKDNGRYSLVELTTETDRKSQIRVQLASIGHPIAGDKRYGAATNPVGRLCLHSQLIAFRHPVTGEQLRFDTGIPSIFN